MKKDGTLEDGDDSLEALRRFERSIGRWVLKHFPERCESDTTPTFFKRFGTAAELPSHFEGWSQRHLGHTIRTVNAGPHVLPPGFSIDLGVVSGMWVGPDDLVWQAEA